MSVIAPRMQEDNKPWGNNGYTISVDEVVKPSNNPFDDPIESVPRSTTQYTPRSSLSIRSTNSSNIGRSQSQHVPKSTETNPYRARRMQESSDSKGDRAVRQPLLRHNSDEVVKRRQPRSPPRANGNRPRKVSNSVPADIVDLLDTSFGPAYHHEGPFDATLAARNRVSWRSPVAATKLGNQLALDATLPADIQNSIEKKQPLDFVALYPPGHEEHGKKLTYEEYDLNRKDGNYRRWDGFSYLDEDFKGKGTEGYLGDLNEKQSKANHRRVKSLSLPQNSYELQDRTSTGSRPDSITVPTTDETLRDMKNDAHTTGRLEGAKEKIKRRFSLSTRRNKASPERR